MAFCGNCGSQAQGGVKFCPACGQPMGTASTQEPQMPPPVQQRYTPPVLPGAPQQSDIRDAQENKIMSILAYIFFFIPLLTGAHKTSPFVKYHTNQGTVLFITAVIWGIAENILMVILRALFLHSYTWGIYSLLVNVLNILWLVLTILCIVGIINAVNGRMRPLPLIGGITIIE